MQKTLGGDRLSSGKRMQVNLRAYERSSHNKGYIWRSTMSPGTIVPFLVQYGTPGSTFDIDLDIDVMTHPTIGPLLGSFKVDAHVFQCPVRLYHAWLHNNKLKIGMDMSTVKLPLINLMAEQSPDPSTNKIDNTQINPSCILAYLGIRGIGYNPDATGRLRQFNAIPLLAYWDIYKNYYSNKQEEIGAVIHGENNAINQTVDDVQTNTGSIPQAPTIGLITINYNDNIVITYTPPAATPDPSQIMVRMTGPWGDATRPLSQWCPNGFIETSPGVLTGTFTLAATATALSWDYATPNDVPLAPPRVVTFNLSDIDDMREAILADSSGGPFNLNGTTTQQPYQMLLAEPADTNGRYTTLNTQEGLGVKTYLSDLFNNWLNTAWIDGTGGINERSRIDTSADYFTLDQLLMGRKIYDLLNRIGISGGTYKDWIEASYTEIEWNKVESPVYWGGLIKELVFQEIVSNSASTTADQPLGTLAGKGTMAKKHKGGKIVVKLEEHSLVMGLISLTPRVDYSQGNEWHTHIMTMDDFHKPAFDEIGFQELITEQMTWWSTHYIPTPINQWGTQSAGKQPAWLNYMTEVNKVYGNFAIENSEMFMTLNRRYEQDNSATIADLTTYIDPVKYNFIFADTSIDAQNFWVQVAVDMTYRAKMSGKLMPNL